MLGPDGEVKEFDSEQQQQMTRNVIEPMASDGLRTIGLAYKDYKLKAQEADKNDVIFISMNLIKLEYNLNLFPMNTIELYPPPYRAEYSLN